MKRRRQTIAKFAVLSLIIQLGFVACPGRGQEIKKLQLPPASGIQRAELYFLSGHLQSVSAVLVLCPGHNENGEWMIKDPAWQSFANFRHLGLMALSFSSEDISPETRVGYYYAANGSGKLLLDGIHQIYHRELPLLLFGFSGGAHFTSRFEEWKPDRVIAWCAYSAGWWDIPQPAAWSPPGLIACGEDDPRLGASLIYLKQGRSIGKPWCWLSIPHTEHTIFPPVEDLTRSYFAAILQSPQDVPLSNHGIWIDIDRGMLVDPTTVPPSLSGWLPDADLLPLWKKISGIK